MPRDDDDGPASWLVEFWDEHRRSANKHPEAAPRNAGWAELSEHEQVMWAAALGNADATLGLALEAGRRALLKDKLRRRETQINLILEELSAMTAGQGGGPGALDVPPHSIEEAKKLSYGCVECGGAGLAVRYVSRIRTHGGHDLGDPAGPASIAAAFTCTCPLGRAIRAGKWPDNRCPYPDLAGRPELQSVAVAWDSRPDTAARYPDHDATRLVDGWRAHVREKSRPVSG